MGPLTLREAIMAHPRVEELVGHMKHLYPGIPYDLERSFPIAQLDDTK